MRIAPATHRLVGALAITAAVVAAWAGPAPASSGTNTAPSAIEFANRFVAVVNEYAVEHSDRTRVIHADCVQASPGHYMCAYATQKPGLAKQCRIMQADWTPLADSEITVRLAGRTSLCGTLREALASLR